VHVMGGFKVQGKDEAAARKLIKAAKALEAAGVFALVLECVPADLATYISSILTIPTIGIGAGAGCDGQVLVYQDMLGISRGFTPKFVKNFGNVGEMMVEGFKQYKKEVEEGTFPSKEHTFSISTEVMDKLYG